jgi:hypothetical protein
MNEAEIARIIIDNSSLLHTEASKLNIEVCRADDGVTFTLCKVTWLPGRPGRSDDEIDDDIGGPSQRREKLMNVNFTDGYSAISARDGLIQMINNCRQKVIPYEEALAISARDLQPGYGESRTIGYHTFND